MGQWHEEDIISIAAVCHEANKSYCRSMGDDSQPSWIEAPEWQQESAINGVKFHLEHPDADAAASHRSWMEEKREQGWKWGPNKDPEKKEHPCFVPYHELPIGQQIKDHIFKNTVHGVAQALEQGLL